MTRLFAVLLFPVALAGCFSADVDLDFSDGENVKLEMVFDLSQDLYGFVSMPQAVDTNPCVGMQLRLEGERVTCTMSDQAPIADAIIEAQSGSMQVTGRDLGPFEGVVFEEVDPRTIKLTLPLRVDPPTDALIEDDSLRMFTGALDGETMDFSVTAAQIIFTTGEVSEDETQATLSLPMSEMLEPTETTPETFEVIFRY